MPSQDRIFPMRVIEPPPVEIDTHFGAEAFCSSGRHAWNSMRGPMALTWYVVVISSAVTISSGVVGSGLPPALEITMSMWSIPSDLTTCKACCASVGEVFSILTNSSLDPSAAEKPFNSSTPGADAALSRILPMTICCGLERYALAKPFPIPGRVMLNINDRQRQRIDLNYTRVGGDDEVVHVPRLTPLIKTTVAMIEALRDWEMKMARKSVENGQRSTWFWKLNVQLPSIKRSAQE